MKRVLGLAVLMLIVSVVVTACGGRGGQQGAAPPPGGATTIRVSETEFKFTPSQLTAPAGQITFELKNDGTTEHNFVIEKTNFRVDSIQPGETKTLTVTLQAGEYRVLCDVPGHTEAGMVGTLKVGQ